MRVASISIWAARGDRNGADMFTVLSKVKNSLLIGLSTAQRSLPAGLWEAKRPLLIGSALGVAAALGWGSFAYVSASSSRQVAALTAERDAALVEHQRLQEKAGQMTQLDERLASARVEYSRVVQGWADAKAKISASQLELASLTKRVEQARDRVSQTGSIKPADGTKKPAR